MILGAVPDFVERTKSNENGNKQQKDVPLFKDVKEILLQVRKKRTDLNLIILVGICGRNPVLRLFLTHRSWMYIKVRN